MEMLTDLHGTLWELIDVNEDKVQLRNKRFNDNTNVYDRSFIENAIQAGLLKRLELENGQVQKADTKGGERNGRSQQA